MAAARCSSGHPSDVWQMETEVNSRNRPTIRALTVAGASLAAALAPVVGAQAWTLKTLYNFCAETNRTDGQMPANAPPAAPRGSPHPGVSWLF